MLRTTLPRLSTQTARLSLNHRTLCSSSVLLQRISNSSKPKETSEHTDILEVKQLVRIGLKQHVKTLQLSSSTGFTLKDKSPDTVVEYDLTSQEHSEIKSNTFGLNALHVLKHNTILAFLPKGYPHSVSKEYLPFTSWQFLQNICGSTTGVLSTQSLLFAVGLGSGSIPLAAALNWIIKDGLGQLGGVVYASVTSDRFDSDPKRHRFYATVAMQCASLLELTTPFFPGMFLVIASFSNIGKNIAWLASAATKAQLNKTFALRDNLGDITGKSGSQSTAAGLAGTGLGIAISALIGSSFTNVFAVFIPLSILSIYANYRSNLVVTTPSLNLQRAEILFENFLRKSQDGVEALTPAEVAHEETFVKMYRSVFRVPMILEPKLHRCMRKLKTEDVAQALSSNNLNYPEKYYTLIHRTADSPQVYLWYDSKAKSADIMKGLLHACLIRKELESIPVNQLNSSKSTELIRNTHIQVDQGFTQLHHALLQKGWDLENVFVSSGDRHLDISRT
ncbi:hypothetical protein K7432_000831 [Basidiobolus ranarum]|uniref:Uncharacterized protein n=1 Tax=Basidiobolus ranarum TaxID=34480 RepID=A0ABR2X3Z3_9FUNG